MAQIYARTSAVPDMKIREF